jgi:preprotein translocase subunit YajC
MATVGDREDSNMNIAYAMGAGPGGEGGGGLLATPLLPIILMLAIMWFLLIRPQQKKQKEHREMVANLKKGDTIITAGGLYGRITGLTDATLTLEIADKVRVKISRGHIAGLAQSTKPPTPPAKEKPEAEKK